MRLLIAATGIALVLVGCFVPAQAESRIDVCAELLDVTDHLINGLPVIRTGKQPNLVPAESKPIVRIVTVEIQLGQYIDDTVLLTCLLPASGEM